MFWVSAGACANFMGGWDWVEVYFDWVRCGCKFFMGEWVGGDEWTFFIGEWGWWTYFTGRLGWMGVCFWWVGLGEDYWG